MLQRKYFLLPTLLTEKVAPLPRHLAVIESVHQCLALLDTAAAIQPQGHPTMRRAHDLQDVKGLWTAGIKSTVSAIEAKV
jgi:hypothetical protein